MVLYATLRLRPVPHLRWGIDIFFIQEKINEEQIELKEKNLAEYREAWRENSSKGSL